MSAAPPGVSLFQYVSYVLRYDVMVTAVVGPIDVYSIASLFNLEFDAEETPASLVRHHHVRLPATFHVPQKMRRSRAAGELTLTLALLALLLPLLVLPAVAFIADIFSHADSMVTGSTAAQLHPPSSFSFSFSSGRGGKGGGDNAPAPAGDSGSIRRARALAVGSRPVSFSQVFNPGPRARRLDKSLVRRFGSVSRLRGT